MFICHGSERPNIAQNLERGDKVLLKKMQVYLVPNKFANKRKIFLQQKENIKLSELDLNGSRSPEY